MEVTEVARLACLAQCWKRFHTALASPPARRARTCEEHGMKLALTGASPCRRARGVLGGQGGIPRPSHSPSRSSKSFVRIAVPPQAASDGRRTEGWLRTAGKGAAYVAQLARLSAVTGLLVILPQLVFFGKVSKTGLVCWITYVAFFSVGALRRVLKHGATRSVALSPPGALPGLVRRLTRFPASLPAHPGSLAPASRDRQRSSMLNHIAQLAFTVTIPLLHYLSAAFGVWDLTPLGVGEAAPHKLFPGVYAYIWAGRPHPCLSLALAPPPQSAWRSCGPAAFFTGGH